MNYPTKYKSMFMAYRYDHLINGEKKSELRETPCIYLYVVSVKYRFDFFFFFKGQGTVLQ